MTPPTSTDELRSVLAFAVQRLPEWLADDLDAMRCEGHAPREMDAQRAAHNDFCDDLAQHLAVLDDLITQRDAVPVRATDTRLETAA